MTIHKKCTRLKQSEFLFNKVSKDTVWECIDCQSKKFPFVALTNHEIQNISFNSISVVSAKQQFPILMTQLAL